MRHVCHYFPAEVYIQTGGTRLSNKRQWLSLALFPAHPPLGAYLQSHRSTRGITSRTRLGWHPPRALLTLLCYNHLPPLTSPLGHHSMATPASAVFRKPTTQPIETHVRDVDTIFSTTPESFLPASDTTVAPTPNEHDADRSYVKEVESILRYVATSDVGMSVSRITPIQRHRGTLGTFQRMGPQGCGRYRTMRTPNSIYLQNHHRANSNHTSLQRLRYRY